MKGGGIRKPPPGTNLDSQKHHAIPWEGKYNFQNYDLVTTAGIILFDYALNLQPLLGHSGGHTKAYKDEIAARLRAGYQQLLERIARENLQGDAVKQAAREILDAILRQIWADIASGALRPYLPDGPDVFWPPGKPLP